MDGHYIQREMQLTDVTDENNVWLLGHVHVCIRHTNYLGGVRSWHSQGSLHTASWTILSSIYALRRTYLVASCERDGYPTETPSHQRRSFLLGLNDIPTVSNSLNIRMEPCRDICASVLNLRRRYYAALWVFWQVHLVRTSELADDINRVGSQCGYKHGD